MKHQIFISYSHKDGKWREELEKHLKPFLRNYVINSWSDQQIEPGSRWFTEIESALANSKLAVLLVSPDFLASNFIHEHELGPILKRAEEGGVKILWIPIYGSAYKQTPLENYQAVLDPNKPLANWTKAKRDQAWVRICEEVEKAVNPSKEPFPAILSPVALGEAFKFRRSEGEQFFNQLKADLKDLSALIEKHVGEVNSVVAPIVTSGDIVETCELYWNLVNNVAYPKRYDRYKAKLNEALDSCFLENENQKQKVKTLLREIGMFQHAAFMMVYGSYHFADNLKAAVALWRALPANVGRSDVATEDVKKLKLHVTVASKYAIQWLEQEDRNWTHGQPRGVSIRMPPDFRIKRDVIDLLSRILNEWSRHVQYVCAGRDGVDGAIASLEVSIGEPL